MASHRMAHRFGSQRRKCWLKTGDPCPRQGLRNSVNFVDLGRGEVNSGKPVGVQIEKTGYRETPPRPSRQSNGGNTTILNRDISCDD
jgi:hypothetical protein